MSTYPRNSDLPPEESPQITPDKNLSRIGEGHPYYAIQQNQLEIAKSIGDLTSTVRLLGEKVDRLEQRFDTRMESVEKKISDTRDKLNRIYWAVGGFLVACGLIFAALKYFVK